MATLEAEASKGSPSSISTYTIVTSSSSSNSSGPTLGWIIAQSALSLTALVIITLGVYCLYSRCRVRRQGELREQQRRDQEQEEARQEEFKKEQRSQNIKEKLRFVDFARNTSSEFSTCTACTSDASSVSWSRRNSRSESASSESGNSCNRFESGNSCNGEENHVHAVDLEAQINKPFNCACSDRDLEAQTDSDEDYCCPICFAEFEEGNLISVSNNTDCKHSFHKECITEWLLTQDGCPVCRRAYLGEEETCDKDAVESSNSSDTEDEDSSISQTSSDDDSSSSTTHATSEENIDC